MPVLKHDVDLTPEQMAVCEAYAHALTAATRSKPDVAGDMLVFTALALMRLGQNYKARLFELIGAHYRGVGPGA